MVASATIDDSKGDRMSHFNDTLRTQRFDDYRYYHQSMVN